MKYSLRVFGCQMNVVDGDRLKTVLRGKGWTEAGEEDADLVIMVTCSIREKAEQKVFSELGRFRDRWVKETRPAVAVIGCMAQRVGRELLARFPWVRLVAGPRHLGKVPEVIDSLPGSPSRFVMLDEDPVTVLDLDTPGIVRSSRVKAYVTIAHGCDNFCTYCIVPYVRGRFQSRSPEVILRDVETLVADGARDVTLLGQNVNSYGFDFPEGPSFPELLGRVADIPGLWRLRFVTSHPRDFTREIVATMEEKPVICPSLNLPIQSGSDRILEKMNRGYTVQQYAEKVDWLRAAFPETGLTTDMIVGFPGETEEDFELSMAAIDRFRYDLVHSAAYSKRPPSRAASMEGQVPEEEKMRRLNTLNARQREISISINRGFEGKVLEVLFEDIAPKGEGLIAGRTVSDKVVLAPGGIEEIGKLRRVRIDKGDSWSLMGVMINGEHDGGGEAPGGR